MHDEWTDRLSDYLDGDLDEAARAEVERHLAGCPECKAVLAELDAVRARAARLDERLPERDLWPGIATRLEPMVVRLDSRRPARRVALSIPQLAAAGIALVALSAGGAWLATRKTVEAPAPLVIAAANPVFQVTPAALSGDAGYDAAIAELQAVLRAHRDRLDSATVAVFERSLAAIDQAIIDARAALAQDPDNEYVNEHLSSTMWRKVQLLRRAVTLAGA